MNSYNGFRSRQRERALRWLRAQQELGLRARHSRCDACGQTQGIIDDHSEDYREPFGDHIGRFGLCYRCHMMVHCRFNHPEAFRAYERQVAAGVRFPPMGGRDWRRFKAEHLDACFNEPLELGIHHGLLADIAAGKYRPNGSTDTS